MTENQLKLNDDETEALLFPFLSSLKPSTVSLPDSVTLGSHNIPFSDTARNLGFILDSKLTMKKCVVKICQTAYFKFKRISSIRRLLKTQPKLLLLPISSRGLTTATVSSWVHFILSSNLSRKFRTLLQDFFSWHPVTTTQHLSWKNCTGFPFQNILSIKLLVCVSVLLVVLVLLTSLNCCMSTLPSCTLRSSFDTLLLTPACWKSNNKNARLVAFTSSLALDPTFGIHSHKTLDNDDPVIF